MNKYLINTIIAVLFFCLGWVGNCTYQKHSKGEIILKPVTINLDSLNKVNQVKSDSIKQINDLLEIENKQLAKSFSKAITERDFYKAKATRILTENIKHDVSDTLALYDVIKAQDSALFQCDTAILILTKRVANDSIKIIQQSEVIKSDSIVMGIIVKDSKEKDKYTGKVEGENNDVKKENRLLRGVAYGGISGAIVGSIVGGPLGAVIGAAVGGIGGAIISIKK